MRTPWGKADNIEILAEGIIQVGTPSHGGVKLDRKRNAQVPSYMRRKGGWYEEDCDWAIVATVFPDAFKLDRENDPEFDRIVKNTLKNWQPYGYEQFYGVVLKEGESILKDEKIQNMREMGCIK